MYNAITIADEILKIAKRKGVALTPMQLLKLVYIAHGWALALKDYDLFKDRIEAWKYGPVIPSLYYATKKYGRDEIPLGLIDEKHSSVDNETHDFLEDVFEKYGGLTAFQLSNLTHRAGTPWEQVYVDGEFNIEIPDEVIKKHYLEKLNERRPRSAA